MLMLSRITSRLTPPLDPKRKENDGSIHPEEKRIQSQRKKGMLAKQYELPEMRVTI